MEGRRGGMISGTHNLKLHFLLFVIKQIIKSIQITLLNEEGIPDCYSFFSLSTRGNVYFSKSELN